jgi:hypothetical protein
MEKHSYMKTVLKAINLTKKYEEGNIIRSKALQG